MMNARSKSAGEKGYVLLSIMLLMTLMVIALTIEAPRIAQQIKREKEEELIHRGNEYKSAIKKYFRKFGRYPNTIEQLENTNNMRFLRQRYKDPFTGQDDWRILHVGEVQINPLHQGANALGQPMDQSAGSAIGNSGSLAASPPALNPLNQGTGALGQPMGQSAGSTLGNPGGLVASPPALNPLNKGTGALGQPMGQSAGSTLGNPGGLVASSPALNPNPPAGGQASPDAAGGQGGRPSGNLGLVPAGTNSPVQFGGGTIIGVASTSKSESIKEINGKNHYNEWYFVYDPRLEQQTAPGPPGGVKPIGGSAPGINPAGVGNNPMGGPGNNPSPGPKTGPKE